MFSLIGRGLRLGQPGEQPGQFRTDLQANGQVQQGQRAGGEQTTDFALTQQGLQELSALIDRQQPDQDERGAGQSFDGFTS